MKCWYHKINHFVIFISPTKPKDISWTIASSIGQINGTKLDTTATIDSQFVKIPESHVQEFLLEIDKLGLIAQRL